ncbi:MAG: chemotaxis protein CheA [candidate division Zixibacteria bacterium]|nr:chemotaxis protein CheA [candidate division Zixibacteria bacterium]
MADSIDFEQDEMREIIDDFLIEADELVESLDNNFVTLENTPEDLNLLNEIFRAVHTIKGTSSFLGFEQVTTLSHKMEDILNKLRKTELKVTSETMDVLLEGLDILKVLLANVRNHVDEEIDLRDILAHLLAVYDGQSGTQEVGETEDVGEVADLSVVGVDTVAESGDYADPVATAASVNTLTEISVQKTKSTPSKATETSRKTGSDQTIRVDVNRLDTLMNMTGELVLGRNCLMQSVNKLVTENEGESELDSLASATKSINFITTELQAAVMKMRMLHIGKVFSRFPRQVRDLSRESGKEIELVISGETTELDKTVIEEIGDPLMHVIRNSCDHGLELPDERVAKGKPAKGTVWLEASQEGSNIVVKVRDDGRGFPVELIRNKAVERGLVTQEEVDRLPDCEVFRFIFEAGFSTAKVVTDVSGRGVGMDVVRTNIEKLNGLIELDSKKDVGSTITIKLPLTLAIIQGLLIQCDDSVFIIPLSSVFETVKMEHAAVYYVNQRPVIRLRDEIIPLINLVDILSSDPGGFILSEKPYIIIVGLGAKKLGLMVDRFLGQEEVVIKSLGSYLGSTEGVAGATILGDGRIRLIVDLIGLFNIASKLNR